MAPMGSLIRRHARELCFAAIAVAALMVGGGAIMEGLPLLLVAMTPGMEARADTAPHVPAMQLALPGFDPGRHAPQILYPVVAHPFPAWLTARREGPVIAICIDDLGEDIAATETALHLPRAVTLAFLPFAPTTPGFAERAKAEGHVVLAHVPMQAIGGANPGPMALDVGMPADEITRRLNWSLARVPGAVGVNNHEGSRFTSDAAALAPVMAILKARGLFFFDSRTLGSSKGEAAALVAGVASIGRDVFLDDDQSEAAVRHQLDVLVATAKRQGVAIAIGHPHEATLRILAEWLAQDHGIRLVTLPEAMRVKAEREMAARY
jgi:polysaccharide deacetylase 2 family uncharacterized protein YibQ